MPEETVPGSVVDTLSTPEAKPERKERVKKPRSEKQIAALLKAREVRAAKLLAAKVQKDLEADKEEK
jgi:hypothetical protein